ncbi:MAG: TGS domain-containing protein [Minisyncoccia bacterium]
MEIKNFYKNHNERVKDIIKKIGGDLITQKAAFLHNLSKEKIKELSKQKENSELVKIIKKFRKLQGLLSSAQIKERKYIEDWQKIFFDFKSENLRKLFFAITKDIRPILILIADHIDKVRHLDKFKDNIKKSLCLKSLEVFSPLCYSLSMGDIKAEIEDIAFKYLYSKEYSWLLENIKQKRNEREIYLKRIIPKIREILKSNNIEVIDIHARAKHYFSLYLKLLKYNFEIEKIYDLIALRIIVKDIKDCYIVLGILHQHFKPLEDRIKDYIANPKINGYRALHTTIICFENQIVEIQIKTLKMHEEAEFGIASHLSYKLSGDEKTLKEDIYWYEKLRQWEKELAKSKNISQVLDFDFFKNRIFVLTPKGDIINLPKDSTPIDFAFAIHSFLGIHCKGAKVNGKLVPLNEKLKTGQVVEIITQKDKTPSLDWLKFVKTKRAKNIIRKFFPNLTKKEATIIQESLIIKKGVAILKSKFLKKFGPKKISRIKVGEQTDISIKIAKCCNPKEGDEILGIIIPSKEIVIHKKDCKNLLEISKKSPERIIKAEWIKNSFQN